MRGHSFLNTMIIGGVALIGLGLFALPVIEDMNDGQVNAMVGNAAASAAMVYVLLTPILLSLTHGLLTRLIAVALSIGAAVVVRTWVGLVDAEDLGMALVVSVGGVAAIAALGVIVQGVTRRRRSRVSAMAWLMARATAQTTDHLRRRYSGSPDNARHDGPLPQTLLVENLVFTVLTQAEAEDTPEDFAAAVVAGLAELHDSLGGTSRAAGRGYADLVASEYRARLSAELRRLVPNAPTDPSGKAAGVRRLA
ncbi:hypothetical protein ACM64Y_11490 [Novispirillum sp. DQ9]|uniref:hypothetical protein n=1 Tax=Novispirillum sp. DQ9 TaxID=3398612 RepID=UPI003C7ED2BC